MDVRLAVLATLVAAAPLLASGQPAPAPEPTPAAPAEAAETPEPLVAPLEAEPPAGARAPAPVGPAAPRAEAPRWSLGAGVGTVGGVFLVGPPSLSTPFGIGIAVGTAFVERRIGERTWVVLAGSGRISRDTEEVESGPYSTEGDDDLTYGTLAVGLRRVVTRPGAVVDVSLVGTLAAGYQRVRREAESGTLRVWDEDTATFTSASGGIALERGLTEALALRVSTPLVEVWSSRLEQGDDVTVRVYRSLGASVTLAPRLELRLAF